MKNFFVPALLLVFVFFAQAVEKPIPRPDYEKSYQLTNELVQERWKQNRFVLEQLEKAARARELGLEELEIEFLKIATEAGWDGLNPSYPASAEKTVQTVQTAPLSLLSPHHRALWIATSTSIIISVTAIILTLLH